MLRYILKTLKQAKSIDEIYVFCSNDSIKEYLPHGVIFLERIEALDASTTKINEVIGAFINEIDADVYVLAHATSPFIKVNSIEKGLTKIISEGYDSALSVQRMQEFLWMDNEPFNYNLSEIPRTQDLKPFYVETTGFYMFKREVFLESNKRVGTKPFLVEISKLESIDIDEKEDFEIADALFNFSISRDCKE